MCKSGLMKFVVLVTVILSVFHAGPIAWAAGDRLLEMTPADSVFCVRLNNLDSALNSVGQFLSGVTDEAAGLPLLAKMQLAKALQDPNLVSIDMAGSFAVFGVVLKTEQANADAPPEIFIGALIPVRDYGKFTGGNTNCSKPDENGICKIMPPGSQNASAGMLVAQAGTYALVGPANNYQAFAATAKSISNGKTGGLAGVLTASRASAATKSPLWAYGNMVQVNKTFGPLIQMQIEQIKGQMENAAENEPDAPVPPAEIFDFYGGLFKVLTEQVKSGTIAFTPRPDRCNMLLSISALPGTDLAGVFAGSGQGGANELAGYLEDGAAMNFAFRMGGSGVLGKGYVKMIDMLDTFGGGNIKAEDLEKLKTFVTESLNAMAGPGAFSLQVTSGEKPGMKIKEVIAIKDAEQYQKILKQQKEIMNKGAIADLYKSFGIKLGMADRKAIEPYKGVTIDSARLILAATEPNSTYGNMLNTIYGGGFDYNWAIVNKYCIYAMGDDSDAAIRQLIDQVKSGTTGQGSSEFRTAVSQLETAGSAEFIGTYNYIRLMKLAFGMLKDIAPDMPMLNTDAVSKSNLAIAGGADNGSFNLEIVLPKQHLLEIKDVFTGMEEKAKADKKM